jgi:hypothetical protein
LRSGGQSGLAICCVDSAIPVNHRRHRVADTVHDFGRGIGLASFERLVEQSPARVVNLCCHGVELPAQDADLVLTLHFQLS